MTLARWIKPLPLVLAIAFVSMQPAVADLKLPAMDGALPFYPKAVLGQSLKGHADDAATWTQLWDQGFPTQVFSQDDESVVDLWYRLHLKSPVRTQSSSAGVGYKARGGDVIILRTAGTKLAPYGKTAIVLNPS